MTDVITYRHRKLMFFVWLRISLIGLISLRISGLWLLTPPATVMGAVGLTLILIAFVRPVLNQHIKSESLAEPRLMFVFYDRCFKCNDRWSRTVRHCGIDLAATTFVSAMMFARNAYRELEAIAESSEQLTT